MRSSAWLDWAKPSGWDGDLWRGVLAGLGLGLLAVGAGFWFLNQTTPDLTQLQNKVDVRTNSLGMRFVWIRVPGAKLIFMGTREVTGADYRLFLSQGPDDLAPERHRDLTLGAKPAEERESQRIRELSMPGQGERPVSRVNYWHAQRFAEWLTLRERRAGLLGSGDRYRLPRDDEWSVAAGLQEPKISNPFERGDRSAEFYGNADEPPRPVAGMEGLASDPVEWCENERGSERIVRGYFSQQPWKRAKAAPGESSERMGFRMILEKSGKSR